MRRLVVLVVVMAGCSKAPAGEKVAQGAEGKPAAAAPAPAPEPEKPKPNPKENARNMSFAEAMEKARPMMGDTVDELNSGALGLAAWGAWHPMVWADVAVAKDETTLGRVRKDSESERGKRLCVSGRLVEISKQPLDDEGAHVWTGNLSVGYSDIVNFIAIGSTGDLEEKSRARLCGVVTGLYAYSNVGGGQTKAVQVVGIFDLPENKPAGGK